MPRQERFILWVRKPDTGRLTSSLKKAEDGRDRSFPHHSLLHSLYDLPSLNIVGQAEVERLGQANGS